MPLPKQTLAFSIVFSHTPRQLANHPFPMIPFAQAFFWQCTLQQRKCLFCLVCLLGCLQSSLGNHCYPWKHHCFLFSAFSLILLLLFRKCHWFRCLFQSIWNFQQPQTLLQQREIISAEFGSSSCDCDPSLPSFLTWKRMREILSILKLAHTWPELEVQFSSGL